MLNLIKGKEAQQNDDWARGTQDGSEFVQTRIDGIVQKSVDTLVDNNRASDFYKGGYLSAVADELIRTSFAVMQMAMRGDRSSSVACMQHMLANAIKDRVIADSEEKTNGK